MGSHILFSLPDEAASATSCFLKWRDLVALTGGSTEARGSHFQSLRDARPTSLVLPSKDPPLAERVLRTLHTRDPLRLSQFKSIVLTTPWQVDLIVDTDLLSHVRSVRVAEAEEVLTTTLVNAISRKLTHVQSLDLSQANLPSVTCLASMTQLRHLQFRQTSVNTNLYHLRSLRNLEELVLERVQIQDMSFLTSLRELRVLKVHALKETGGGCCGDCGESDPLLQIPNLHGLNKLHTVSLIHCSIYSIENVLSTASHLQRLIVFGLETRYTYSTDPQILEVVQELAPHVELNVDIDSRSVADVAKDLCVTSSFDFNWGDCDY